MSLADTDNAVVTAAVEAATDAQLVKVVEANPQTGSNPISMTLAITRAVALAWANNWPSVNGSRAGDANDWRKKYNPLGDGRHLSKEQIALVIRRVREEYTLRQMPVAMNVTPQVNGLEVTFTNTRTGGNPFATTAWAFGDGQTSNTGQPVHTYATSGTYHVTCDIVDTDGEVGRAELDVTVE